ncbi:MAG: molybdopterin-dependent oxidoreductase [Verrucomicrobia bacterium]|nr:molybdopterin-dependent oxidoreductase [Verrucomicrobiota bacterium]
MNGYRNAVWSCWGPRFALALALGLLGPEGLVRAQGERGTATAALSPGTSGSSFLGVGGQVPNPGELTASHWARLPRTEARVTTRQGQPVTYGGVSLCDVLRAAGVMLGEVGMPSREAVASYVVVEGADGYRAVFALAELDPAQTDRVILLADRKDGEPLPAPEGPLRVVVPGEKRPARWVRQVRALWIGRP